MSDNFHIIRDQIKSQALGGVFVLCGEEWYLKDLYLGRVLQYYENKEFPEFNIVRINEDNLSAAALTEAFDALPMMSDSRLVIIKNSGAFKSAKEEIRAVIDRMLKDIAPDVTIMFDEKAIDGRSALLKKVKSAGHYIEFARRNPAELKKWVLGEMNKEGFNIQPAALQLMMERLPQDMGTIRGAMDKLCAYCYGKDVITATDVESNIHPTIEDNVFTMIDLLASHHGDKAFSILTGLKLSGEGYMMVLTLLGRHINILLKAKTLKAGGADNAAIAKTAGIPPFFVSKYLSQATKLDAKTLKHLLTQSASLDSDIKSGKVGGWTAVELLMCELLCI